MYNDCKNGMSIFQMSYFAFLILYGVILLTDFYPISKQPISVKEMVLIAWIGTFCIEEIRQVKLVNSTPEFSGFSFVGTTGDNVSSKKHLTPESRFRKHASSPAKIYCFNILPQLPECDKLRWIWLKRDTNTQRHKRLIVYLLMLGYRGQSSNPWKSSTLRCCCWWWWLRR